MQAFPEPGTAPLDPEKAKVLQAVVDLAAASPDVPTGSRGATAAVVTDRWTWSGAAGTDVKGTAVTATPAMSCWAC
jgi:D-alanyl-D-alanine carboxypeptidase